MGKMKISEWMWRFLASVILIVVGWTIWIIYQLNPSPLITNAAFEAAAKARANDKQARANDKQSEKQSAQGVIALPAGAPAKASGESPKAADAAPAAATSPAPEAPKEPPINPEKLRFSDSIAIPVPNAKK